MMIDDLKQVVALVTGAAGGIGNSICKALHESGAKVIAADLDARVAKDPNTASGIDWVHLDVTSEDQWIEVARNISERYGRLDVLVNNAAVAPVVKLQEMSLEQWRNCQSVNTDGMFLGLKTTLPLLVESGKLRRGGASVINMSSAGGMVAAPFNAAYCSSKGAVRMLTKAAAVEFSALGHTIRVNSIHPGCTRTEMMDSIMQGFINFGQGSSMEEIGEALEAAHPLGRLGEPGEIAKGVLYLASDASSFVHGSELVIDGGFTSR